MSEKDFDLQAGGLGMTLGEIQSTYRWTGAPGLPERDVLARSAAEYADVIVNLDEELASSKEACETYNRCIAKGMDFTDDLHHKIRDLEDQLYAEFNTNASISKRIEELENKISAALEAAASVVGTYNHHYQLEQATLNAFDRMVVILKGSRRE